MDETHNDNMFMKYVEVGDTLNRGQRGGAGVGVREYRYTWNPVDRQLR